MIVQRCTGNTDLPILALVWFVVVSLLAVDLAKYTSPNDCFVFFLCISTLADKSDRKCPFTSLNTRLIFVKLLHVLNNFS